MWHKACRTFHPWCICIKTRCLYNQRGHHTVGLIVVLEDHLNRWWWTPIHRRIYASPGFRESTYCGRDKMDAISQTTFSRTFPWMKMFEFRLKFHWSKGRINNIPALVQIMAWRRSGDKPLSEPMMCGTPTHICVTRPQWVNSHFQNKIWDEKRSIPFEMNFHW